MSNMSCGSILKHAGLMNRRNLLSKQQHGSTTGVSVSFSSRVFPFPGSAVRVGQEEKPQQQQKGATQYCTNQKHFACYRQLRHRSFQAYLHQSSAESSSSSLATFSSTPNTAADGKEVPFLTPRVEDLYKRITLLDKEEVYKVGEAVLDIIEKPVTPGNEFYYNGFGLEGDDSGTGSVSEGQEEVQEAVKDVFDLKLAGFDAKGKIKVIKEVRALLGLGLKEAKEMVEGAPKVIQKNLKKEAAEEIKGKLEAVGAKIELV